MNEEVQAYAFGAMRGSYRRYLGWQAYAAANRYGYMPSEYEWIEQGMLMFNRHTVATIAEAKAVADNIVIEMGKSVLSQVKGHFTYPTKDGEQYVTIGHDVVLDEVQGYDDEGAELTHASAIQSTEIGYDEVDDADEMRYRLRIIAERLRPDDMVTLLSYVDGEYDTLTEACGSKAAYNLFTRRMKVATRGMVLA
jgi:hypothetical protein